MYISDAGITRVLRNVDVEKELGVVVEPGDPDVDRDRNCSLCSYPVHLETWCSVCEYNPSAGTCDGKYTYLTGSTSRHASSIYS